MGGCEKERERKGKKQKDKRERGRELRAVVVVVVASSSFSLSRSLVVFSLLLFASSLSLAIPRHCGPFHRGGTRTRPSSAVSAGRSGQCASIEKQSEASNFLLWWSREKRGAPRSKGENVFFSPLASIFRDTEKTLFQPTYRASDGAVDGGLEGRLHLGGETGLRREGRVSGEEGGRGEVS